MSTRLVETFDVPAADFNRFRREVLHARGRIVRSAPSGYVRPIYVVTVAWSA